MGARRTRSPPRRVVRQVGRGSSDGRHTHVQRSRGRRYGRRHCDEQFRRHVRRQEADRQDPPGPSPSCTFSRLLPRGGASLFSRTRSSLPICNASWMERWRRVSTRAHRTPDRTRKRRRECQQVCQRRDDSIASACVHAWSKLVTDAVGRVPPGILGAALLAPSTHAADRFGGCPRAGNMA